MGPGFSSPCCLSWTKMEERLPAGKDCDRVLTAGRQVPQKKGSEDSSRSWSHGEMVTGGGTGPRLSHLINLAEA